MDVDEKLTALKQAYADIILSISKEAAARVLASERKSARYQHELKVTKEEGVRMLMRLKQMMDYQVSEAEATSLNQQKKIEELEAQLYEAEDIVKDLREELENVQAELGKLKNENLQHVNEPGNGCLRERQSIEFLPPNESSLLPNGMVPCVSQRNGCMKCHNKLICTCSAYVGNRDLPSIILRGQEPGQYRNGCTHRILACERNLLDRDLCLSEETDEIKDKHNDREQEAGLRPSPDVVEPQNEQGFAKSSEKENNLVEICYEKTMSKDGVNETMVPMRVEAEFSESLQSPDSKLDAEKVDLPAEGLQSNSSDITNVHSSEPVKERVIKYTFQRKRKRQVLSDVEVNGSVKMEQKMVDVKNNDQKMEQVKPSRTIESSRESRRLAQVARQLISLSERKWWH